MKITAHAKRLIAIISALVISSAAVFAKTSTESVPINSDSVPQRIVSLAPACSEILCAVGAYDQIAARTDFCNYPAELSAKPSVGGFSADSISLETILAYKPDFIYGNKAAHAKLVEPLKNSGIKIYLSDANTIDSIIAEIEFIGTVTGHKASAESLTADMKDFFAKLNKLTQNTEHPSVYFEIWNPPLMCAGGGSFINELIEAAGGKNIFADLSDEYPIVSEEAVIALNPQIIIVPIDNGLTLDQIKSRSGWQNIDAVKNDHVFIIPTDEMMRTGPRITDATAILNVICVNSMMSN